MMRLCVCVCAVTAVYCWRSEIKALCYVNSTALSTSVGCKPGPAIMPVGEPCPSNLMDLPIGNCGDSIDPVVIRIGTTGGTTGDSGFVIGQDDCFVYNVCTESLFPDIPPKWHCTIANSYSHGNAWTAQHANGEPCDE